MFKFSRVNIEITQHCFLNCSFCPSTGQKLQMPLELFERACQEVKPYTSLIALHILGDPLSVPDLKSYLDVAHHHHIRVEITTAGLFLSRLEPLMTHIALKQVNFSLTSFFANSMKISFETYMKDIINICLHKKQYNKNLFINLRFWDQENDHLQEVFDILNAYFVLSLKDKRRYRLDERIFLCLDSLFVWPSFDNPIFQENGYCLGLQSHIGILVDGRVVPCCLDHRGEITLGNLKDQCLNDILQSPRAINMREGFLKGILQETFCKHCGYIQRFVRS